MMMKKMMTNKEWIESQNLSFAEGLKLWNKDKYPDFSEWLKANHRRFKVGDVIASIFASNKYVVLGVDVKDAKRNKIYPYNLLRITPDGKIEFTSNEDVENGKQPEVWAPGTFEDDPDFTKIA